MSKIQGFILYRMQSIESSIEAQLQMNIKKNMYEIKKLE